MLVASLSVVVSMLQVLYLHKPSVLFYFISNIIFMLLPLQNVHYNMNSVLLSEMVAAEKYYSCCVDAYHVKISSISKLLLNM